jgi:hypothetical protein
VQIVAAVICLLRRRNGVFKEKPQEGKVIEIGFGKRNRNGKRMEMEVRKGRPGTVVASLLLTTDAMIAEKQKKEDAACNTGRDASRYRRL